MVLIGEVDLDDLLVVVVVVLVVFVTVSVVDVIVLGWWVSVTVKRQQKLTET